MASNQGQAALGAQLLSGCGTASGRGRVFFIDWMRVVAIYLVVSYHVVQCLDWVGLYTCGKKECIPGMSAFIMSFRASALQIGMPMFFHISGRASALSPIVGFRKRIGLSFRRLMLPFLLCYMLLIPPWQYIDKEYDWDHPSSFTMKTNPITWLLRYYTSSKWLLYFDMAWLWFLPALFMIQLICTPLFLLAECYNGVPMKYLRLTGVIWPALMFTLIMVCGFSWAFGILAVLGPLSATVIAQFVPMPQTTTETQDPGQLGVSEGRDQLRKTRNMWLAIGMLTIVQVASSTGLVLSFGYADIDPQEDHGGHDPRAGIPFIILCTSFYVHGYFLQRWLQGCSDSGVTPWWVWLSRLVGAFVMLLMCMVSSPQGDVESGHFIYPIYSNTYSKGSGFGAVYVLGTWAYIFVFGSLFNAYVDDIIHPTFYKHATNSTIVVYIFHWLFLKVCAFWMLNPALYNHNLEGLKKNLWVVLLFSVMTYAFSVAGSLLLYAGLLRSPRLGAIFGIRA